MKTLLKDISIEKSNGQFYSPDYIVYNVLDMSGYYGNTILQKHAIDNSCGDGAFLVEMVRRYCEAAKNIGISSDETARQLSIFIHGIEINAVECEKCISNVTKMALRFNIRDVKWDIHCNDAMSVHDYDRKMDFVLGNPPYVRVHNAGETIETIKTFSFAQNGMTDLYIVFYELGLRMLNKQNELDFINCIFYNFSKIINTQIDPYKIQLVPPNELQNFNSINNYGFNKVTESIYNAILLKNLYAGDSVVPFVKNNYKNSHEILLAKIQSGSIYDYYFDANAKLRCDLSTNYNLLIKNFLNLLLYDFYDYQAKELLLAKLCLNFGNIYTTTT